LSQLRFDQLDQRRDLRGRHRPAERAGDELPQDQLGVGQLAGLQIDRAKELRVSAGGQTSLIGPSISTPMIAAPGPVYSFTFSGVSIPRRPRP